jgi:hypothetical protein
VLPISWEGWKLNGKPVEEEDCSSRSRGRLLEIHRKLIGERILKGVFWHVQLKLDPESP